MDKKAPLFFVLQDSSDPRKSRVGPRAIASHVSARYKPWQKTNRKALALDSTTKAILTSKPRAKEDTSLARQKSTTAQHQADATRSPGEASTQPCRESATPWTASWPFITSRTSLLNSHLVAEDGVPSSSRTFLDRRSRAQENSLPTIVGSSFLDPFTPIAVDLDSEITPSLSFYFKVIRPYALYLMSDWDWPDSLPVIRASPALSYAVAAFSSLFISACIQGGPGIVVPPPAKEDEASLWPIPPWFRLHTSCLAELSPMLADPEKVDDVCFQTILFLLRIAIFLADGESVRMHYHGLKRLSGLLGREEFALEQELVVAKVSLADAFLHNSSVIMLRETETSEMSKARQMLDLDKRFWQSDRDWHRHQAGLNGRLLSMRTDEPADVLQTDTACAITHIDPDWHSGPLDQQHILEIQYCYQIALYVFHHLNAISFHTDTPEIRAAVSALQSRLSHLDMGVCSSCCPRTMFNILFYGAMASRCSAERPSFIERLAVNYPDTQSMYDVLDLLNEFVDASNIVACTVEEVWDEVSTHQNITLQAPFDESFEDDLDDADLTLASEATIPMIALPDLTRPLETIQPQSSDVFPDFHVG